MNRMKNILFYASSGANQLRRILLALLSFVFLYLLSSQQALSQAVGDYQSVANNTWSTLATWQRWSGTAWATPTFAQGYPGQNAAGAAVTIQNGNTVTLNVSPANSIASLTLQGGGTATGVTFGTTNALTVSGAVTINASLTNGVNKTIAVGAGTLNAGSITMANTGGNTRDAVITLSTGTITITGNLVMAGTFLRNHIDITGAGTINIGGNIDNGAGAVGGGFTTPPATSTINLNGASAQTVFLYGGASSLGILKINNAAGVTSGSTFTTVALTIGDVTPNSIFDVGTFATTVSGNLTVNGSLNGTGAITLSGAGATINGVGSIAPPTLFSANHTVNATADLTITGTMTLSTGITVTNNGAVTATNLGTGTGAWTQGNNSALNYSGASITPTLTATAAGNTVNYNGAGAQTVNAITYNNLTLSGSGAKTTTGVTVNGILSMEGTAIASAAPTYGVAATLQYNTSTSRTAGVEWLTPFAATGGIIIANTGTITLNESKALNANIPLTINNGASLTANGYDVTLGGNYTNNGGTFTPGSGTVTFNGTGAQQILGTQATKTFNNVVINKTAGQLLSAGGGTTTITLSGNLTMTQGNFTSPATLNISGSFTHTAGTLTAGANINIGGDWIRNGGTFTPGTGTVTFNGGSAQNINGSASTTFYNLTLNNASGLTLGSNTTISNVLTLTSGILNLSDYRLTISNTGTGAISGSPFSVTKMIQTDGSGYVEKAGGANGVGLNIVYPVGTSGYYNPFDLTGGFTATSGAGNIQIRAVVANQGANALTKYWELTVTGTYAGITSNLRFTYNAGEVRGAQSQYDVWYYNGTSWISAPGTHTGLGVNPFGSNVSGVSAASISGRWSAGSTAPATSVSLYSYQSGNWADATSWTSDPSGTLWIYPGVPSASDNVTILNGRTITVSSNSKQAASLTINQGGILDIGATTGHNFGNVSGQGKLMLSSNNFPGGTFTSFVSSSGGTIEYYNLNNVSISTTLSTYNNLIISNYSGSANTVYLNNGSNPTTYEVNGNLSVKNYSIGSQTFSFGNPTPSDNLINLTVYGNFTVDANCNVRVNNFATGHAIPNPNNNTTPYPVHTFSLYGNLTNNGSVRLTGLSSPAVNAYYTNTSTAYGGTNYGAVQVFFKGATNNTVTCNGITDFFRLIVEKGTDKTYTLEVNSSNTNNFALYAPNYQGNNTFGGGPEGYGYGAYYKALYIHYGTLKLNENITIPSLTEGGQDFNVIPTAGLWINGANVSTTVSGVNGTGYQAATLYGSLRISAGQFSTGDAAGIVLGTAGTPTIRVEETGVLDVSQAWTATGGSNQMSFVQTGGTSNFRMQGEQQAGPMLNLSNVNAVFIMSGGSMNFEYNNFVNATFNYNIIDIECQPGNYEITGGTINFNLPSSATTYTANSTVPFYNLNISRRTGAGTVSIQWNAPSTTLAVLNNLSIGANSILNLNTSSINLAVGGDFTVAAGGTYTPATGAANTTTFNGNGAQLFNNIGTITGGALNNVTVTNSSSTSIISNNVTVNRALTIDNNATLNDSGRYVYVLGNIVNRGTHRSQLSGGGIRVTGTTAQTIDGGGTGSFYNLIIDKPNASGVSLIGNVSVSGNLRLINNANFNLGSYTLSLSASSNVYTDLAAAQNYDNTHMVYTGGLPSDGGLSKTFNASNNTFLYPVGIGTSYRPARIQFAADPTQYGSIAVRPVLSTHPLVQSAGGAITLYWKTTSSGFSGIQSNSINQTYYYNASDAPTPADEVNYIPGVYNAPNWATINDPGAVNETLTPREIHFDAVNYINGEYTAGLPAAFTGLTTYYSNSNNANVTSSGGADWNVAGTWSIGSHTGTPVGALADNMSNAAFVIGDGGATGHRINITGVHQISTGNITIRSNSVLDIGATTGHNFGAVISEVTGNGTLRISSNNYFPRGDWADFLNSAGGTVEYYQTASGTLNLPTTYLLPGGSSANITTYYNLTTLPYNASNIILPNTNLIIHNNFTVGYSSGGGTTNCITQLNAGGATTTLEVQGNIAVNQYGILQFMNNAAQNVIADNSITIASGGALQVRNGGTSVANSLTVYGSITNNGTLDLDSNYPTNDNYYSTLTFTGNSNKLLTSTSTPTRTRLYNINVNIGSSKDSILNVNIEPAGFQMGSGGIGLSNGTFRLTSNVTMNLSTGSFIIPGTACLSANGGTFNIATGAASADLNLDGRLEVLNGAVNVGPAIPSASANSFNIIYAAAGAPEIVVAGGALNVYSQIRREAILTSGSLNYTQTGGTVTIGAKNANTARAAFEVLNSGSKLVMSSGTLIIANHISTSTPYDLTLSAATSTVTGGTIQFGLSGVTPNQTLFHFQSSNAINNLTLEGTSNARAIQQIQTLNLKGSLTIGGAASYYDANGLDVYIGGNLTNNNTEAASNGLTVGGYRTQVATQITTFNSTVDRTITGTAANRTSFANLVIAPSAGKTITLSIGACNIAVNGALTLSSGTLNDGSNTVYLLGNVNNGATHYSPNATTGGMLFAGTANQVISGNGTGVFGNIEINNGGNGVNMTNNSTINGQLKFTSGRLYIDDYALTLGVNATIAGTVNSSNMILLNGVSSDKGVTKIFPTGAYAFTFPVGSSGKYTPCTFNFSSNSNSAGATIKVIPVDNLHPTVDPGYYSNYLNYYWHVMTAGFSSAYNVTHTYTYIPTDVQGNPANIERYNNSTAQWTTVSGTISSPTFSFSSSALLDGSYTIGDAFADLPVITSVQSGNWNNAATWDLGVPNGNPVVIRSVDSVALSANGAFASSVTVNGVLDAMNTTFHNLGEVSGSGKIKLLSTTDGMFVFPAGSYDNFFADAASTVEFYGNTNGTLPLDVGDIIKPYQQVIFSGNGIKYISAVDMKIIGNVTIMTGSKLDNSLYNKDLYILGNWIDDNTGTTGFTAGTGTVQFSGTALQNVTMANNTMTEIFYNLAINNAAGVTIQTGNAEVNNQLILVLGNINTNSTNTLTINNTAANAVAGGSVNSFVNGPLKKKINNGSNFQFPVGDAVSSSRNRYGYVSVTSTSTSGTQIWTAQFFDKNPATDGYDIANKQAPLTWVTNNEYWNIIGPSGGSANVVLSWDTYTGMSSSASARAQARVAEWNVPVASKWNSAGQTVSDYGKDSGTVATSTLAALENRIFTISAAVIPSGTLVWAIQTGMWNNPLTWNTGYVPGTSDTVLIGNPYTVTLDVAPAIAAFRIGNGGSLTDAGLTMTVSNNILLDGTWSGSGVLNWTTDNDTLNGTGSFAGTPALQVNGNKVVLASSNVTLPAVTIASGKSLTNYGTVSVQSAIGVDGTAAWINEANSALNVSGALMSSGVLNASAVPNTVAYNGTGAQTILPATYYHLQTANSGTKTIGGNVIVQGNLTIGSGTTLDASSTTDTVYGNWVNNGSFTASTSTIAFGGSSSATITGATTFNNVAVNKADSAVTITLLNTIQAANLSMLKGTMYTGSNAVTVTNSRTGNGIIIGTVTRTHAFALSTPYMFEGPSTTITFTSGTTPTSVTVTVVQSQPASPIFIPVYRALNISTTGGSGLTSTLRLHYENSETDDLNETIMTLWKDSSGWRNKGATLRDSVGNYIEVAGISFLSGDWGIGSSASSKTISDINGGLANAGDSLLMTINITNPYKSTKPNIAVSDPLSNYFILKAGSISDGGSISGQTVSGTGSLVGGTVTWPNFSLASGISASRTFKVLPDSSMNVSELISNTASINFGGANSEYVSASITIRNSANINIDTNVVSIQNPIPGDTLTYTLKYSNTGTSLAKTIVLTYTIPGNTAFVANGYGAGAGIEVNGVPKTNASDADEATVSGTTITVMFPTLSPGTQKQVKFKTVVN